MTSLTSRGYKPLNLSQPRGTYNIIWRLNEVYYLIYLFTKGFLLSLVEFYEMS